MAEGINHGSPSELIPVKYGCQPDPSVAAPMGIFHGGRNQWRYAFDEVPGIAVSEDPGPVLSGFGVAPLLPGLVWLSVMTVVRAIHGTLMHVAFMD